MHERQLSFTVRLLLVLICLPSGYRSCGNILENEDNEVQCSRLSETRGRQASQVTRRHRRVASYTACWLPKTQLKAARTNRRIRPPSNSGSFDERGVKTPTTMTEVRTVR